MTKNTPTHIARLFYMYMLDKVCFMYLLWS